MSYSLFLLLSGADLLSDLDVLVGGLTQCLSVPDSCLGERTEYHDTLRHKTPVLQLSGAVMELVCLPVAQSSNCNI